MRFFQRASKYFLSLCLVYIAMLWVLSFTEMMVVTHDDTIDMLFSTPRGIFMVCAVVLLSLAYPFFGFMKRRLKGSINDERDIIKKAFDLQNYKIFFESEERLVFVPRSIFKRLGMMFEDHILVTQVGDEIELRGNRKGVAYVAMRLERALKVELELKAEVAQKIRKEVEREEVGEAAEI